MAELKIGRMVIGMYGTNCYLVYREGRQEAIVVDPADKGEQIYEALREKGFTVSGILLTHGHFDHIWGTKALREKSGAPIYALDAEAKLCEDDGLNVSRQAGRSYTVVPDVYVRDGEEVCIADITCKVIATPGHTADSCCYYFEEAGFVVCGDTIFFESVGRTDLPTGSGGTLERSIRERIFTLPDSVQLYPGHGDSTTVEHEKKYNPFF
ncbi:MAG: MBL fold metallo-hydrolase [Lachnospiraceae bacterium]|nr:MBL fold metallo-hydrolase [Lachnospiraceae bacterium]